MMIHKFKRLLRIGTDKKVSEITEQITRDTQEAAEVIGMLNKKMKTDATVRIFFATGGSKRVR